MVLITFLLSHRFQRDTSIIEWRLKEEQSNIYMKLKASTLEYFVVVVIDFVQMVANKLIEI
jgi:hypothetical protein